jgi:hypothetical protein
MGWQIEESLRSRVSPLNGEIVSFEDHFNHYTKILSLLSTNIEDLNLTAPGEINGFAG